MAMSENEAIKFIGQAIIQSGEALEKLQSIKSEAERIGKIGEYYANLDNCVKEIEACRVAMNALSEIQQYRAIGTVEEFKALKEKSEPKEPDYEGDGCWDGHVVIDTWICPNCSKSYEVDYEEYDYCPNCGQHIDHSGLTEDD